MFKYLEGRNFHHAAVYCCTIVQTLEVLGLSTYVLHISYQQYNSKHTFLHLKYDVKKVFTYNYSETFAFFIDLTAYRPVSIKRPV